MKKYGILSTRMRELREESGLTQKQVADILRLERSCIAKYEAGESSPNPDMLLSLAKIYKVSVDYLIGKCSEKDTVNVFRTDPVPYETGLPIIDTHSLQDLSKDEQMLVLYFRLLDNDKEIVGILRDKYLQKEDEKNKSDE